MTLSNLQKRDIEGVIHPYTNIDRHRSTGGKIIERGEGVRLFDERGRDYIDALAGLWCASLGYSNAELVDAACRQLERLPFAHLFAGRSHDPAIELAEKLKQIAPTPMSKVFFANSGSEANDTQIKLVWYFNNALGRPRKKKIISRVKAYHGVTIGSASLTGLPNNHRDFDLPITNMIHTGCPHFYRYANEGETEDEFSLRMARELENLILDEDPETVAAFIAEPVMGAGGVILPPSRYFERVQEILRRYDIWFIDDEVICGFGRTGQMFGAQTYDLTPDSISVAKGLTSAYLPLSAVLVSEPMYEALAEQSRKIGTFGHGFTYSGHPVSAAVALKAIEIYERDRIVDQVRSTSDVFLTRLHRLADQELVGETRGVGLIGALELVADKASKRPFDTGANAGGVLIDQLLAEGVMTRALGDAVAFCPPLIISVAEIEELFDKVEKALRSATLILKDVV